MNVRTVGFKPGRDFREGIPIVMFQPHGWGWRVLPFHNLPANRAACARLQYDTPISGAGA